MKIQVKDSQGEVIGIFDVSLERLQEDTNLFDSKEEDSFLFLPVQYKGEVYHFQVPSESSSFFSEAKDGQFGEANVVEGFSFLTSLGNVIQTFFS